MIKRIDKDIVTAMKEKNKNKVNVLKQVKIKATEAAKIIAANAAKGGVLNEENIVISDDIVLTAIKKEMDQLKQTYESVKIYPDKPICIETIEKIEILKEYMPEMLTGKSLENKVREVISSLSDEEKKYPVGRIKGIVIKQLKTVADSKDIGVAVETILK